ncbi:MAG: hypothetical protein H7325_09505 [Pedobacter sp.]|nr:hypothetical protein [Pedobacter sp.]
MAKVKEPAYQAVNKELVALYWHIGEYVSWQVQANVWGKSVVQQLADFIQTTEPNIKGFSAQTIWRMKQFYETYKGNEKLATLWRELSWSGIAIAFSLFNLFFGAILLSFDIENRRNKWAISLDAGSQMNKIIDHYESKADLAIAAGVTKHKGDGKSNIDKVNNCVAY